MCSFHRWLFTRKSYPSVTLHLNDFGVTSKEKKSHVAGREVSFPTTGKRRAAPRDGPFS